MYDAIDDPYTYENSTVLVNKLDLRSQAELDNFEAEISSARAEEPLPLGVLDFTHYKAVHHHLFQDVTIGPAKRVQSVSRKAGILFAFPKTSKIKRRSCSTICVRPTTYAISTFRCSLRRPHTSSPNSTRSTPSAKETAGHSSRFLLCWPITPAILFTSTGSSQRKCWRQ